MARIGFEKKKKNISEAATKVFYEKGYQNCTLRNVADEAHITKGGIYHYFETKEEVLGYVLINNTKDFVEEINQSIEESKKKGLDQIALAKKLLLTYAQRISVSKNASVVLMREMHQLSAKYKDEILKAENKLLKIIRDELMKIDNITEKFNPNVVAFMIIGTLNSQNQWFKEGKSLNWETVVEQNIEILFNGILLDDV